MAGSPTRRTFLKSTLALGSGLASASRGWAAPVGADKKKVELAIATITCDGFDDLNFEPSFNLIPRLPYRNVEFNCWYGRNLTPAGIASIQDRCHHHGLTPVCVQGSSFGAAGNIVKDVAHKLWNMEAARKLGCRRVKFTGARRGTDGGLDAVIQVLKELAPAAEEMDILVLVENHVNNNLENIADYDAIFDAIPSDHIGMCMDNAHFDAANVALMDVVDRFHSRIMHIDLKDTERMGIHKVVRYGQGVTNNIGVVEKMLSYGYTGYLLIEMAPPIDPSTLEDDLRFAHTLFSRYER